jgi:hypothetical protein
MDSKVGNEISLSKYRMMWDDVSPHANLFIVSEWNGVNSNQI